MEAPRPDEQSRSYQPATARRRRYSVWTILAPACAIILWVSFFTALGKSCVFKDCADAKDTSSQTAAEANGDKQNDQPRGATRMVREGDTLGKFAKLYDLTEEELKACNPLIDPQALQPGTRIKVSAIDCEDADKAAVGANPDPLAGDTTGVGATTPPENGTAAADPSAQADAPTDTTADQGDEG
jgi:LysM repeat protein